MADEQARHAAQAQLVQARALMETAMSPLARLVEQILQGELDALTGAPPAEARKRVTTLFERPPDLQPAPGMAREIVRAGGNRLVNFLCTRLGEDRARVVVALDDYVSASERFLEPVLLRHMSS